MLYVCYFFLNDFTVYISGFNSTVYEKYPSSTCDSTTDMSNKFTIDEMEKYCDSDFSCYGYVQDLYSGAFYKCPIPRIYSYRGSRSGYTYYMKIYSQVNETIPGKHFQIIS